MNDSKRLKAVIDSYKLSVNAFAKEIGLERAEKLYQVLRGRNGISKELAKIITTKYNDVNYSWLISGIGDPFNRENDIHLKIEDIPEYDYSITELIALLKEKDKVISNLEELKEVYKLQYETLKNENIELKEKLKNYIK